MVGLLEEARQKDAERLSSAVQELGGGLLVEAALRERNLEALPESFTNQPATPEKQEALQRLMDSLPQIEQETPPEKVPDEPHDFSAVEMIKNVPGSAANLAKDIWQTVRHPVDAGKAILSLADSVGNKMGRKVAEIVTGTEIEPMEEYSEDVANAVGQALVERYGSIDALKNTVQTDPVGFLTDISAGGTMLKVGKVPKVAAAIEPTTALAKTVRTASKALIPEGAAARLYESAAKFSTTLTPKQRKALVDTALKHDVMPTKKGVKKVQSRIDALNERMDSLISAAMANGVEIPVGAIFSHLKKLRQNKGGVKLEAGSDLAAINAIAARFHKALKGRKTVTPEELQAFKIDAYEKVNWDAKRMTGTPIKEDTFKAMARGAKDALAQRIKDAPEINATLSELYELQPHLTRVANRIDNRNFLSINAPLNVGAGGIAGDILGSGGAGMTAGFITAALGNPKMKSKIALALNKIKEGDIGWLDANVGRAETVIALTLAGRAGELLNDQEDQ